jgi:hypothetical protein
MFFMRSVPDRLGASVAATGLALVIAGTFLPWLRSGVVLRDSYQSAGALRVFAGGGATGTLLNAWLMVIPVCGLCVALYAVRLRRVSAGLGCVVAGAVAVVAIVAHSAIDSALIDTVAAGPAVTLAGAVLALVGSAAILVGPQVRQLATTRGSL